MARPKVYESKAERQAAYRGRKEAANIDRLAFYDAYDTIRNAAIKAGLIEAKDSPKKAAKKVATFVKDWSKVSSDNDNTTFANV